MDDPLRLRRRPSRSSSSGSAAPTSQPLPAAAAATPATAAAATTGMVTDYEVQDTIGTGTFGICRRIRRKADGAILVWKELNYGTMTEKEKQMLVSEVNILREFQHPNIVRYYDRIIDKSTTTIYIIMEHCGGGDLATLIKERRRTRHYLDESFVQRIFRQIASALLECHRRKGGVIMHRDLKPANIFLDSDQNAKLGDFGLARVLAGAHGLATTFVGTPYYMSPEQITEQAYNEKSDIWSLGCIIYELAALRPPFDAHNQASLAVKIRAGHFDRLPSCFSSQLNSVISRMLQQRCEDRPSIEQLCQDPYLCAANEESANSYHGRPSRHSRESQSDAPVNISPTVAAGDRRSPATASPVTDFVRSLQLRETALLTKERALAVKEAELAQREREVARKERILQQRERLLDMARPVPARLDSAAMVRAHRKNRYSSGDAQQAGPLTPINLNIPSTGPAMRPGIIKY